MLTLFAMPKPFAGHIGVIQRNAIRSWILLEPRPQILLIGNETGVAEIANEFGLTHVPETVRNAYGTPLLDDVFARAEALAETDLLCYVNADIVLTSDLVRAVQKVSARTDRFLIGGRRWDTPITDLLDFEVGWESRLRERVLAEGRLDPPGSIDFFVFPRGLWSVVPPFAIGRFYWDSWLIYRACQRGALVIDATAVVLTVHQSHGYQQSSAGSGDIRKSPEALRNIALAGGEHHMYTLGLATHLLTEQGLIRVKPGRRHLELLQTNWRFFSRRAYRTLQAAGDSRPLLRPLVRPLLFGIRAVRPLLSRMGKALVKYRDKHRGSDALTSDFHGDPVVMRNEKEYKP